MGLIKNFKSNKLISYTGVLLIGVLLGWVFLSGPSEKELSENNGHEHEENTLWTCSMHPQIKKNEPGNCPICGMELIPMKSEGEVDEDMSGKYSVKLSNAAMKIAEVEMTTIQKKVPYKEIYLPGKVLADERNVVELTSRYSGRIEKLTINFTGQKVKKGAVLAKIYSPELITAQKELFEAIKFKETSESYYNAAKNKLKLWDLTDQQIADIEKSGKVNFYFDVLSPITGTVIMRHVSHGDYVKEGTPLFQVIDLSKVWVMFDAYESDIPWVKLGDKIRFKIKSIPYRDFESEVTFIDPVLNVTSRVAKVRAELNNPDELLKPGMLAEGILKTMLPGSDEQIIVPKSSILWTGKKAVVYVMTDDHNNMFQFREIELGAEAGEYYAVQSGLEVGEMVASNGVFKIDAAAQLKGEKSMMNPEGGKVSMGHNHGGGSAEKSEKQEGSKNEKKDAAMNSMNMDEMIDEQFKTQFEEVYLANILLTEAFIASDPKAVGDAVAKVREQLKAVDMSLITGEIHKKWMKSLQKMNSTLGLIESSSQIDDQRAEFASYNDAFYQSIKMVGLKNNTAYYKYCPMARDSKGAYWFSNKEKIDNPYFGEAMLGCGEVKEVIN